MAITANGVGSGLDINGLVTQLMTLEARPLTLLNTREASFQARLSAFGQMKSALTPLQTALSSLKDANRFGAMGASLGDTTLATASADNTAVKGSYNFQVLQIAQGQRVASAESGAPSVAAGSLTFNFGRYETDDSDPDNPVTSFTQTSTATVTLDAGADSLEDLRDAINESDAGARAQIINNGTTDQLIIAGNGEGAGSAFQIVGSGGLSGFSYDASTGASNSLDGIETAQDARIRIDGITLTRTSNTITDAIDGVTLNLLKGDADVTTKLTIAPDRSAVKTAIESLVTAYNEFNTTARGLTAVDPANNQASVLTGDATARGVQNQIRNAFNARISTDGGVSSLSEIGLTFNRDGSLSLDSSTLNAALNDPDKKVAEFFTGADGTSGFANALGNRLDGILGTGGVLDSRTDGINRSIKSIDEQRDRLESRLEMVEKRYRAQFTALDALIGSLTQTSTYLQQQLANLPTISSNTNRISGAKRCLEPR